MRKHYFLQKKKKEKVSRSSNPQVNVILCFSLITPQWNLRVEGSVWAVGGLDQSNALAAVERLDPREGKWVSVPPLSQRRSSSGLAALGKEIKIGESNWSLLSPQQTLHLSITIIING